MTERCWAGLTDGIADSASAISAGMFETVFRNVFGSNGFMAYSDAHPQNVNIIVRLVGIVLLLAGLILFGGGVYLAILGGSWYYLLAGLGIAAAGYSLLRGRFQGVLVYLGVFVLTCLWAFWEAGFNFWPLVPRLVAPIFIAAAVLLIVPLIRPSHGRPFDTRPFVIGGLAMALVFVGYFAMMFRPHDIVQNAFTAVPGAVSATTAASGDNWYSYGKTGEGARYAPFDQINTDNVKDLEVAWTARTGFIADQSKEYQDQNTPLYVDGTLYQCAANSAVTALDGVTGEIKWQFDPKADSPFWKRCRTLGYFDPGPGDQCGPRIVMTTVDTRLFALKASDGQPCESFGTKGAVDLTIGMTQAPPGENVDPTQGGPVLPGFLVQTTGPFVANDKIVLGAWVADNYSMGEPSGAVRAYDARTGQQVWAWDLGNPSITNVPPPGEAYTEGTPNVWSAMAFDTDLKMIYLPLGNATPDYYGGDRRPFDDEYNSSVVALDFNTGKEVWHFRTMNHDIWDYDVPAQPNLADIPDGKGGTVPVVIQTTKRGQIFVLDRRTGVPVKTVEEKPAPKGDGTAEGEYYAETQPYSTGMHAVDAEPLTEATMWGATPIDQMLCRIMFRSYRYEGDFTAHSTKPSIIYPGNNGGINWGSATVDQERNILITADMRMPIVTYLIPREEFAKEYPDFKGDPHGAVSPQFGLPFAHHVDNFMSALGIPCQEPPWGNVTAVDLATGKLVWQHPAGTAKDVTLMGINLQPGLGFYVGMPALGGPISTKGGLTFHGGTQDYYLRAYGTETGEVLWEGRLPSGAQSTPMTYVGKDGRQYVVTTAGGARYNPNDWGDYIVAFALPKK